MRVERFAVILLGTVLLTLGSLRWSGVTGNTTDSEPRGLYLREPGQPIRGGIVQLRPLMKHIAGVPGDTIVVTNRGSYINGRLWPHSAIPAQTYGYRPFPFGTYQLQPGQYWVLGTGADSWDSRWIGPIPQDLIASNISPLWTEK
jgi:type IV secretory pathway protease TraF